MTGAQRVVRPLMLALAVAVIVLAVLSVAYAVWMFLIDGDDVPILCADQICETDDDGLRALWAAAILGALGWVALRVRARTGPRSG
jgi:L-aminopeptidase/D-esterase-like protein